MEAVRSIGSTDKWQNIMETKPKKGDYIYSRGFRCWVSGETCTVYGGKFNILIYDEGPKEGQRNLVTDEHFVKVQS